MNAVIEGSATGTPVTAPYKVDAFKGSMNSRVSSQWFSRPDDQRFTSLEDLQAAVVLAKEESRANLADVRDIRVISKNDDPDYLGLSLPDDRGTDGQLIVQPNNWAFGQMCSLLSVPAGYLTKLPAKIAGINMQYALMNFREEVVKTYVRVNGKVELRAATGPQYGRIFDAEVVEAVRKIAGNGTGDTRWKVPGCLNWTDGTYDPNKPITKQSTTLFASDRDVFMFLVDDRNPIEIGKLKDGSPDLVFRGFFAWNSEVGSKTFGLATFYLRGVCQNRCLWGVEGFEEITIRHSRGAPDRFMREAAPALETYANQNTGALLAGVKAAKLAVVAKNDEQRAEFLGRQGFTKPEAKQILEACLTEEGKAAESVWDFVQGITAAARSKTHQDQRIDMERKAGKLLDKVAA